MHTSNPVSHSMSCHLTSLVAILMIIFAFLIRYGLLALYGLIMFLLSSMIRMWLLSFHCLSTAHLTAHSLIALYEAIYTYITNYFHASHHSLSLHTALSLILHLYFYHSISPNSLSLVLSLVLSLYRIWETSSTWTVFGMEIAWNANMGDFHPKNCPGGRGFSDPVERKNKGENER